MKDKNETYKKFPVAYICKEAWNYRRSYFFIYTIKILLTAVQPFISIWCMKLLIDELMGSGSVDKTVFYTTIMIAGNLVVGICLDWAKECISQDFNNDFSKYYDALIGKKVMRIDYNRLEEADTLNKLEMAKEGMSFFSGGIGGACEAISAIIAAVLMVTYSLAIIVQYSAFVLILVAGIVIFTAIVSKKVRNIQIGFFEKKSIFLRGIAFVSEKVSNYRYGKDIRLFSAANMMLKRIDNDSNELVHLWKEEAHSIIGLQEGIKILMATMDCTIYLVYGILALKGLIGIGMLSLLISTTNVFKNSLHTLIENIQELKKKSTYLGAYVDFMGIEEPSEGNVIIPKKQAHFIEFRNVSFCYPHSNQKALDNVSFSLSEGEHVSIVGENGAGKTTIVKLLCRLYKPTEGKILIDGVNIYDVAQNEYYELLSAVFQDYRLLPFSVRENICLRLDGGDEEKLIEILKQVGIYEKVISLKDGLDTNLFRAYDRSGYEPSGGEQQKLAIARALYKDASVVIMDEPTAALDPIAESEVYKQFTEMVVGKTAILISHRLSSCKFCDKVIVLKNGKVIEEGTHDELMELRGNYFNLFSVQARYYK